MEDEILWNPKFYYRVRNSSPLDLVLICLLKIDFTRSIYPPTYIYFLKEVGALQTIRPNPGAHSWSFPQLQMSAPADPCRQMSRYVTVISLTTYRSARQCTTWCRVATLSHTEGTAQH
jgi:hypothetical protein